MDADRLTELRALAADFRAAIERSRAERATPALPYFPEGACRLVSRLLALHLARRHTWLVVEGAVVDLAADPFGEAPVVVGAATAFHAGLDALEEEPASATLAALSGEEAGRLQRLLAPIEARLPGFAPGVASGAS